MTMARSVVKRLVGYLPGIPESFQRFHMDEFPIGGYRLDRLVEALPNWAEEVAGQSLVKKDANNGRILIVGALPWWVEHAVATALLLRSRGYQVDVGFFPYRRWAEPTLEFDVRRQRYLMARAFGLISPLVGLIDLSVASPVDLPEGLVESIEAQAEIDVQYTLQREEVDLSKPGEAKQLFDLRRKRNTAAARAVVQALRRTRYESVVIPNGSILEFGAVYRSARFMNTHTVTYEFGEQRQRVWLDADGEVMRLNTGPMWKARGEAPLTGEETGELENLYKARRGGRVWRNFARQWQAGESQDARDLMARIGLEAGQKLVLLCTNVVGDSLALDRQVFTRGMADWLRATVRHLADRQDCKLVVRVHPGEMLGAGHPSSDIVAGALSVPSDRVVVIPPDSSINTYDLVGLAHLGLVYTTTVGMEMAMAGIPVVVAGDTHYRGKGFTNDPENMEQYLADIDRLIDEPLGRRLPDRQVDLAHRYAYRFFFEYPFPFPWHIVSFWEDMETRPLEGLVSGKRPTLYEGTLRVLAGDPISWERAECLPERGGVA